MRLLSTFCWTGMHLLSTSTLSNIIHFTYVFTHHAVAKCLIDTNTVFFFYDLQILFFCALWTNSHQLAKADKVDAYWFALGPNSWIINVLPCEDEEVGNIKLSQVKYYDVRNKIWQVTLLKKLPVTGWCNEGWREAVLLPTVLLFPP